MLYPDGLVLEYDDQVYRINGNTLLPFVSWNAACSWGQPIIVADEEIIEDNYDVSRQKLGFRPGAVVRSKDGKFYYIEKSKKRELSDHAFRLIGFNAFEVLDATDEELAFHPTGDIIG